MSELNNFCRILESHGIDPSSSCILDIGCGNGNFTLELSKIFKKVVAIDSSEEAVKKINNILQGGENNNISVLHLDASKLMSFGDDSFDVILVRNSLHFVDDVAKLYDDVKFILKSHGIFIKISNPLFQLSKLMHFSFSVKFSFSVYPEDANKSFLVNAEVRNFTETKFIKQLESYWTDRVKENFVKFCDPFRKEKLPFLSTLHTYELESCQRVHIIDLKKHFKDMAVIDRFIVENGEEEFESLYHEFLQNILFYLDFELCDMYFEDIVFMRKDTHYIEVQLQNR